jgi:hypothetical protein
MSEMQGLGRHFNVAPIVGAGAALSMKQCAGITFICTGNDTFTITTSATFTGSYATPGNIITTKYTNTSTSGTAAWVKASQAASNAVTIASGTVAIFVGSSMLADPLAYVKCTASGAGLVFAILHDLEVQRTPANLTIVSA